MWSRPTLNTRATTTLVGLSVPTGKMAGMYSEGEIRRALIEGRRAELRAPNPYYGCGDLAVAWLVGYRQMVNTRIQHSRQMVAYYRAHAHLN